MRGGICDVIKRCSKANNEFFWDYDPTKEKVYINYIDMNNLYGYAMSDSLPYEGLELIEGYWWNNKRSINCLQW